MTVNNPETIMITASETYFTRRVLGITMDNTEQKTEKPKRKPVEVRRGQVIKTPHHGEVVFDGLDFYFGQCTAKLRGITHPGDYYPKIEQFQSWGFNVIDR